MKRKTVWALISFLAVLMVTGTYTRTLAVQAASIPTSAIVSIPMTISIDGLAPGEQAMLRIGVETASLEIETPLFEYPVQGIYTTVTINVNPILNDGYYLLLLEAPQKYFREPKGYAFMVRDSAVINPTGRAITFALKPQPAYAALEAVVGLSAPAKAPMPIFPIPLWQRLVEPIAITCAIIMAGLLGVVLWRVARKHRMVP